MSNINKLKGIAGALALLCGAVSVQPALAQSATAPTTPTTTASGDFSSSEGLATDGSAVWQGEAQVYGWLPKTSAKIGLGVPNIDINGFSQPTVANVLGSLNAAVDCECTVRYGNWSGEMNIIYLSLGATKPFPPLLPMGPTRSVHGTLRAFMISPGIGYRVLNQGDVSLDLRAGFTYSELKVDANIVGSQRPGPSRSVNFAQPWIGERLAYYPTPRWRLQNTLALTGLGANGGSIGWNGTFGVSYLVARWFDVTLGYAASQTYQNKSARLASGVDNTVNLLNYGPYFAAGIRF